MRGTFSVFACSSVEIGSITRCHMCSSLWGSPRLKRPIAAFSRSTSLQKWRSILGEYVPVSASILPFAEKSNRILLSIQYTPTKTRKSLHKLQKHLPLLFPMSNSWILGTDTLTPKLVGSTSSREASYKGHFYTTPIMWQLDRSSLTRRFSSQIRAQTCVASCVHGYINR